MTPDEFKAAIDTLPLATTAFASTYNTGSLLTDESVEYYKALREIQIYPCVDLIWTNKTRLEYIASKFKRLVFSLQVNPFRDRTPWRPTVDMKPTPVDRFGEWNEWLLDAWEKIQLIQSYGPIRNITWDHSYLVSKPDDILWERALLSLYETFISQLPKVPHHIYRGQSNIYPTGMAMEKSINIYSSSIATVPRWVGLGVRQFYVSLMRPKEQCYELGNMLKLATCVTFWPPIGDPRISTPWDNILSFLQGYHS